MFKLLRFNQPIERIILIVSISAIIITAIVRLTVEVFWFEELGYLDTFLKVLFWQLGLWFASAGISLVFLLVNLRLAENYKWHYVPEKRSYK
ncbi:MAG: UPF0182 family protein, partial [Prochloraceae cyanobacterium]